MIDTQKIIPMLWFDREAEQAARYYVETFGDGEIVRIDRYGPGAPGPEGAVMLVTFRLFGQTYQALNGGPLYKPTEALSLAVTCQDQAEVDRLWERLTADGGMPGPCGWLKDRWGFSWQIVPKHLFEMMRSPDSTLRGRVFQAMTTMGRLDIATLEMAAAGVPACDNTPKG